MRRHALIASLISLLATGATAGAHVSGSGVVSADIELQRLDAARAGLVPRTPSIPKMSPSASGSALPGSFELVGHDPLLSRGMNAALAVHEGYVYVGSRTDGTHLNAGVLVVDARDPSEPEVVYEIGRPSQANVGETSRELRVLPEQELLLVLNHACSELIHRCANPSLTGVSVFQPSAIKIYDIAGGKAAAPELIATYRPSRNAPQLPHEFFVWSDPQRPGRVLLYETVPSSDTSTREQLIVTDFSQARDGVFKEIAKWRTTIGNPSRDNRLHSLTVSHDGRRAYLAYLGGGFLVADTSDVADAVAQPEIRLVTPVADRVFWTDPGAHSAIRLPGRDTVMVTDEVYGKLGGVLAAHGCPWGWVRFIDIADPAKPTIQSEYRLPVNDPATCASVDPVRNNFASFSAHNPTVTENLAILTWHSAGLQAIDTSDPANPTGTAEFLPTPLPAVQTEDPALSSGFDKVVMWSFPVIVDGLIYVVDLRNGLYILRYDGPHEEEVDRVGFLDGNSNSGDVGRMETAAVGSG